MLISYILTLQLISYQMSAEGETEDKKVKLCLHEMATSYFVGRDIVVYTPRDWSVFGILNMLFKTWSLFIVRQDVNIPQLNYYQLDKTKNIIVFLRHNSSSEIEDYIEHLTEGPLWNPFARILLVLDAGSQTYFEDVSRCIIKTFRRLSPVSDVIMMFSDSEKFYFYSWHQDRSTPQFMTDCDGNRTNNLYLLQKIPFNYELKVTSIIMPPFSFRQQSGECYKGLEDRLITTIANHFNMKITFVPPPKNVSYLRPRLNKTHLGGAFSTLYQKGADIAYGSMKFTEERYQIAEAMPVYLATEFIWLVPSTVPRSAWKNIYDVFSWTVWGLVLVSFIMIVFCLYFLAGIFGETRYKPVSATFSISLAVLFTPYASLWPNSLVLRIFIIFVHVYAIHITTAYKSSLLFNLIKPPPGTPYQKIEEALDAGLNSYLFPSITSFKSEFGLDLWERLTLPEICVYTESIPETLDAIANKSAVTPLVGFTADYFINHFYIDPHGKKVIEKLSKPIFPFHMTFYMPKNHHLKDIFYNRVQEIIETGIVDYWLKDIVSQIPRVDLFSEVNVLTITHLEGAFAVFLLGLVTSVCVYIAEMWFYRVNKKRVIKRPLPKERGPRESWVS